MIEPSQPNNLLLLLLVILEHVGATSLLPLQEVMTRTISLFSLSHVPPFSGRFLFFFIFPATTSRGCARTKYNVFQHRMDFCAYNVPGVKCTMLATVFFEGSSSLLYLLWNISRFRCRFVRWPDDQYKKKNSIKWSLPGILFSCWIYCILYVLHR